jgi:hypothetical protein
MTWTRKISSGHLGWKLDRYRFSRAALVEVLEGEDVGSIGAEAVLEGIEFGIGLPLFRAWASGFLRIQTIRVDLGGGCHTTSR